MSENEINEMVDANDLLDPDHNILHDAHLVTAFVRQEEYGSPLENFSTIAEMWSAILGIPITTRQVGLCMIALKIAREANGEPKRDNLVDIAGYARCIEMVDQQVQEILGEENERVVLDLDNWESMILPTEPGKHARTHRMTDHE